MVAIFSINKLEFPRQGMKSVGQVFDSTLNQCLSLSAQRLLCTLEQRSHPLRGGFFSCKKFVFQE